MENAFLTLLVIRHVKEHLPNTKIYLWTGYTYETLIHHPPHPRVEDILDLIDVLIDGPYIEELKDIRLNFSGSSNQLIIDVQKTIKSRNCELYLD